MFDPQTAGGLLAGVPQQRADECISALRQQGYPDSAVIGVVEAATDELAPIRLELE